jgi:phosphatidylserine/phosphatidylglycerophosphate/cardiolipin synthase-like enzyme
MNKRFHKYFLNITLLLLILESCLIVFLLQSPSHPPPASVLTTKPIIRVCFTPGEDCTGEIIQALSKAKSSLYIQAYSFTSTPIAKAVVAAKQRGVEVKMILDKSQLTQRYSSAQFFMNQGIPIWIDNTVAIAHNKIMIIDDSTVITGSFNFTQAAQKRNAENVFIVEDKQIAQLYKKHWQIRLQLSKAVNE